MVACIEEVAYNMGFITAQQARDAAQRTSRSGYGEYLQQMLDEIASGER